VMHRVALMSIKPEYATRIFCGEKRVELRRQRPGLDPGDVVVVYATSPTRAVAGAFRVAKIVSLRPSVMWRAYGQHLGIRRAAYDEYFSGSDLAHGIEIEDVWSSEPWDLSALRRHFAGFHPPQSYMFWPDRWSLPDEWRQPQRTRGSGKRGRRSTA